MNLNDFFSKPSHVKEAYSNNYPSYTPPAAATDVSSDSDSEPKFNRLDKTGSQPEFNFRTGLASDDGTDYETENEPELGTFRMGKPVEPDDAATNAFMAALTPSQQDNRFTAPAGWRYVEKDEDPARYGSAPAAATSALPNLIYDPQSRTLKSADALALDMSPKSKFKFDRTTQSQISAYGSGANPNIDNATRDRARAWAARKNAVAAVKPVAAPAVVKPAVVPPAALRDIPVEKPSSWKDIAQANNIANPDRIMPGQVLKIPGRADYVVQPGDTLGKIAAGQTKAPKYTPTASDTQPAATAALKKNPNLGLNFPLPRSVQDNLGMGGTRKEIAKQGREELLTPAMIKREKQAAADIAKIDAKMQARAEASRKKVKEDDIDEGTFDDQTQVSSIERDSTSDIDGKTNQNFSSTSFQQDPANPGNNSYMDRQENNGVSSTTFARNVTPKWMSNLKATAGLPGAKPAAQPPSQYPTQVGQGENNKPFAAYSTPPGQLEINRESLDRMRSLAGIHKK